MSCSDLNHPCNTVHRVHNSLDGIVLLHPDLAIRQTNSSFNRLFACTQDDCFGKSFLSLVHSEDRDLVTKIVQMVTADHQSKSIDTRAVQQDGSNFDAELTFSYIEHDGLVCTLRNITERKSQERQLRYHAKLQENVSEAVIVTDTEFRIQSWNIAAELIYGWSTEEVIGKATATILHNEFLSSHDRARSIQQLYELRMVARGSHTGSQRWS